MRHHFAATLLLLASSAAYCDATTRPIDYLDADFAARCSALHVALSARQAADSKEANNNMLDAAFFAAHARVSDDQIRRLMPWASSYWENNALDAVVELSFCGQVSETIAEIWTKTFRE